MVAKVAGDHGQSKHYIAKTENHGRVADGHMKKTPSCAAAVKSAVKSATPRVSAVTLGLGMRPKCGDDGLHASQGDDE